MISSRRMALRARLSAFAPPAILLFLIFFIYNKVIFRGFIFARGDIYLYFYPYWTAARQALLAGHLPLWNPDLFMGAPFLANSQVGLFYPLNWLVWWLWDVPAAVSASVVLHLCLAGLGAYVLGRRALSLSRAGGFVAGLLFALGGYLTAQVEHINQLQGLAWLPWLLLVAWGIDRWDWRLIARRVLGLAALFSLQFLAGHGQTLFISAVGVILWLTVQIILQWRAAKAEPAAPTQSRGVRLKGPAWLALGLAVGLTALLVGLQLVPSLELAALSRRQGGLPVNEALSFSLHPLLFARSILPSYGQGLYLEYRANLPLSTFVLAFMAALAWRQKPQLWPALALVLGGMFLAFGLFNPIYHYILVHLPGFDLFRAPARWLSLYALGMALMSGAGWDLYTGREEMVHERLFLRIAFVTVVALIGLDLLSTWLAFTRFTLPPESLAEWPMPRVWIVWAISLAALYFLLPRRWGINLAEPLPEAKKKRLPRLPRFIIAFLILIGLFSNIRHLSLMRLTVPEAYTELRPAAARLAAAAERDVAAGQPVARFLSMSQGTFDPGDMEEINSLYAESLPEEELYLYVVTVKEREIVAPNLSMNNGLAAVDGFDGGLLPLRAYSQVVGLLAPTGQVADGRLRESLRVVPEARWLDLFNVRYLITDKVGDRWVGDGDRQVFFDLQHPAALDSAESISVAYLPDYEATELWLLAEGQPGQVTLSADGQTQTLTPEALGDGLYRAAWPQPLRLTSLRLTAGSAPWRINGLALVDTRDDSFQSLTPGNYRLIHSGDVKIYENLDVLPRAFLVNSWQWAADEAAAVAAMADPAFDPARQVVLVGQGQDQSVSAETSPATVSIDRYAPEQITLRTQSASAGYLLVTDSDYPGWEVTVDGQPAPIVKADGLFRAVWLEAGEHVVVWAFRPKTLSLGLVLTALGGLIFVGLCLALRFAPTPNRRHDVTEAAMSQRV